MVEILTVLAKGAIEPGLLGSILAFFCCNFKGSPEFLLELMDEETMGNSESAGPYSSKNFPLSISKVLGLRRSISKLDHDHLVEFSVGIQEEPHIFHRSLRSLTHYPPSI